MSFSYIQLPLFFNHFPGRHAHRLDRRTWDGGQRPDVGHLRVGQESTHGAESQAGGAKVDDQSPKNGQEKI